MNNLKSYSPILLLLSILLFNACGNDDDITCVESDFIGTWSGDVLCDSTSGGSSEFHVLADDGVLTTLYIGTTELTTTVDNCNFSASGPFGNSNIEMEGTYNGTTMEVNIKFKDGSLVQNNCDGTFSRD